MAKNTLLEGDLNLLRTGMTLPSAKKKSTFNPRKKKTLDNEKSAKFTKMFDKQSYKYGKPGWFCCDCDNFNYKMRKKCNKCQKARNFKIEIEKKIVKVEFEQNLDKTPKDTSTENWLCAAYGNSNLSSEEKCFNCTQ